MKIQQLKIKVRNLQEYRDLQDSSTSLTHHVIQLNHVSKTRILKNILSYKTFKEDLILAWQDSPPFHLAWQIASSHHALLFHANSRIADLPSRNTLKKQDVDYSITVKKNVITSLKAAKNFFVTMKIQSQPGLDKFYLGVVGGEGGLKRDSERKNSLNHNKFIKILPPMGIGVF